MSKPLASDDPPAWGALRETHFWLDSEVGRGKYQVSGEVVREIVFWAKAYNAYEESKKSKAK
jgi:hypothetical protein